MIRHSDKITNILASVALVLFFAVIISISAIYTADAQSLSDTRFLTVTEQDIILRLSPENPDSNEIVQASISSFAVNLQRLRITWLLNGQVVESGIGETDFTFINGRKGDTTSLDIFVQVDNNLTIKKSRSFSVSDVDLLWQAIDSYTPPFSRLRKLPARESLVRVVALPNFNNLGINAVQSDLVYNWERNGTPDPSGSGYGLSSYTFRNDILKEQEEIGVTTGARTGASSGTEATVIDFIEPEFVVYHFPEGRKSAVGRTLEISEPEGNFTLVAEPYFYSVKPISINVLSFNWHINNNPIIPSILSKNRLDFQAEPGAPRVRIGVEHPQKILQFSPDKEIIVNFSPE